MKRGELRKLSDSARRKVSRNFGFRQSGYINWIVKDGYFFCLQHLGFASVYLPDFVIVSPKNLRQRVLLFSDVLPSALFGYKPPCSKVA